MKRLISHLLCTSGPSRRKHRKTVRRAAMLERLEHRELLAASSFPQPKSPPPPPPSSPPIYQVAPYGIDITNEGVVIIQGDSNDNRAVAQMIGNDVQIDLMRWEWQYNSDCSCYQAKPTQMQSKVYNAATVTEIRFYGMGGDDDFANDTSIPSRAHGGSGDDVLTGGLGQDDLNGGDGNDTLEGRGGDDRLNGQTGNDTYLFRGAGLGSDVVNEAGNRDQDVLDFSEFATFSTGITVHLDSTEEQIVHSSGGFVDLQIKLARSTGIEGVVGTDQSDTIYGNARDNYLDGGDGDDTIVSGSGVNTVLDGSGNDTVDFSQNSLSVSFHAGAGNDTITGTQYGDQIWGGDGDDVINGLGGADTLFGEGDDDQLVGGVGNDSLYGGFGNDTLVVGSGYNSADDGPGHDLIDFSDNAVGVDYVTSGGGDDTVYGSEFDDMITGSSGDDRLEGNGGNDRLYGLAGTDELYGGGGNDWLEAGSAEEIADGQNGMDYNAYVWAVDGTTSDDVNQEQTTTCVFLSALAGAAAQGMDLNNRITYLGGYKYRVQLHNPDTEQLANVDIHFDGELIKKDGELWDPRPKPEEFWTVLFQRAYLEIMNKLNENYKDYENALFSLTGRDVTTYNPMLIAPESIKLALLSGKVVIAGGADKEGYFVDNHAYTVLNVFQEGNDWYILLRNPWAKDGGAQPWQNAEDGLIAVGWNDFVGYYDFATVAVS